MKKLLLHTILICLCFAVFSQSIDIPIAYYKALGYKDVHKNDSAIITLNECLDNPDCIILKAEILIENRNYSSAQQLLKNTPDFNNADYSVLLSRIYAASGFADESVFWLEKHFESRNVLSYSQINSFYEFDQIKNTEEWRNFWNNPRYNKNEEALFEAEYLIKSEKNTEALAILNSSDFGSREYIKNTLLAEIAFNEGSLSAASNYLKSVLLSNPDFINALELKYKISLLRNDFVEAEKTATDLIKYNPQNPENLLKYSEACLLSNKNTEALYFVNIFCECFPQNEDAFYLKTRIQFNEKDYRNAIISLNRLIEINPSEKEYFALRGTAYYNLESWQFARFDLAMALDIDPNQAELLYKMGMCWHELGFDEKACSWWQKAANRKHRPAAEMLFKYCF
jgi:tetratricopeptide (TPR) repeat protein